MTSRQALEKRDVDCAFCKIDTKRVVAENELSFAIRDSYPVSEHHTLIIPKRHVSDFFELYQPEINAVHSLLLNMKSEILSVDSTVTGFNVGVNVASNTGQSIFHVHVHLIPRRNGDVERPRGGVRGINPRQARVLLLRAAAIRLAIVGDLLVLTLKEVSLNLGAVDDVGLPSVSCDRALLQTKAPSPGRIRMSSATARLGLARLTSTKSQNLASRIARQDCAIWIVAAATAVLGIPTLCPASVRAPQRSNRPCEISFIKSEPISTFPASGSTDISGQAAIGSREPGNPWIRISKTSVEYVAPRPASITKWN